MTDHDIEIAKQRCRDEAGMDPDFIGTKGYPNWQMFTEETRGQTRAFIIETAEIVDDQEQKQALAALGIVVGKTVWFVGSAESDEESVGGDRLDESFLYSATFKSVEQFSVTMNSMQNDREFTVSFEESDDTKYFSFGKNQYRNSEFFETKEAAIKSIRGWYENRVADSLEELNKARAYHAHVTRLVDAPIIETTLAIAQNFGFRLSTLKEEIANADAHV